MIVDQDILRLAGKLSVVSTETEWRCIAWNLPPTFSKWSNGFLQTTDNRPWKR